MSPNDEAKLRTAVQWVEAGMLDKGLPLFKELAHKHKGVAVHQYNYGNVLRMSGRLPEAVRYYAAAIRLDPTHVDAALNLALAYCELGRLGEALSLAKTVLTREPANPIAALVLNLAIDSGALDDTARDILAQVVNALEANANASRHPRTAYALGIAYLIQGRQTDAANTLAPLLESPELGAHVIDRLQQAQAEMCRWDSYQSYRQRMVLTATTQPGAIGVFGFMRFDEPEILKTLAMTKAAKPAGHAFNSHRLGRDRLRIGYLSPDFRHHPTAFLTAELFERHDRAGFDVHLFSYGPNDGSPIRARLVAAADRFHDLHGLTSREIAHKIHGAHVDILVDLAPFIGMGRMEVAALRPAPLQINWLGYPGTTGAPYIDYIVGDHHTLPAGHQTFFTEAVVRLPVSYQSNDRKRTVASVKSKSEYGLPASGRVLAAFHQSWKIQPETFAIWCRLLCRHGDTSLWFGPMPDDARHNLIRTAQEHGVASERLVFGDKLPNAEHLARYQVADLMVDTFPYGGHTTLSDALWQGCPAVTLAGRAFHTRVGASLLHAAGLGEYVTASLAEYEAKLDHLLADPQALPRLHRQLREQRDTLPLFDTPRLARELEYAYRTMAERARAGLPPQPFDVPLGGKD